MTIENNAPATPPVEIAPDAVADNAAPEAATFEAPQTAAPEVDPAAQDVGKHAIRSNVNRAEIAERFAARRREAQEQIGFEGSYADPATLAGKLIQEQPDDPPAEPAAAAPAASEARESGPSDSQDPPAQAPAKRKLVVRREEREVDEDEFVRLAQIGAAGQEYLAEAKRLRDEAEALRNAAVPRPTDARSSADPEAQGSDAPAQSHPTEDEARTIAERIQFGTTEEAAEAVRGLLARKPTATTADDIRKVMYDDQRKADLDVSNAHYQGFAEKNAELFKDPRTRGALTEQYLEEVRKDLRHLGYTDDRLPTDVSQLRETHRFHRIHGKKVRDTAALLADSKQAVDAWKGGPEPAPAPGGKINVNVDRTERRQAIPPQPARAAVPPLSVTSPKPVQSARSEAVREMIGKRRRLLVT